MNNEMAGSYVLHNGKTINISEFDYSLTKQYPGVYEVIRIIDGVPLFIERHLKRFRASSGLMGWELKESDENIYRFLKELVTLANCQYGNMKIVINNLKNPIQDCYVYMIKSSYPTIQQVENGVPVILYRAERNNPNAKSTDLGFREKINDEISKNNAYEALLVNKHNQITEGSKSNVFFVKGEDVYTPPLENVLPGVTRGYVLEICSSLGLRLVESAIDAGFLSEIDGLFLTGTSPQVLPISSVDDITFMSASNNIVTKIRKAYEKLVSDYVESNK